MIPAAFDYHAPTSLDDALRLLGEGDDVKVLAGGQSLIPVMRLRLAAPETVVDLGKIDQLLGIREDGDALVIGAMTPHADVAASPVVREHARLSGFPADVILEITGQLSPRTAEPRRRARGSVR